MSWGAIYCDTWFGEYRNVQYSDLSEEDCFFIQFMQDIYDRVDADGGTIEVPVCTVEFLQSLKDI